MKIKTALKYWYLGYSWLEWKNCAVFRSGNFCRIVENCPEFHSIKNKMIVQHETDTNVVRFSTQMGLKSCLKLVIVELLACMPNHCMICWRKTSTEEASNTWYDFIWFIKKETVFCCFFNQCYEWEVHVWVSVSMLAVINKKVFCTWAELRSAWWHFQTSGSQWWAWTAPETDPSTTGRGRLLD